MTTDEITALLDEAAAASFGKFMAELERLEGVPSITRPEWKAFIVVTTWRMFERTWSALVRKPFVDGEKGASLNPEERRLAVRIGQPRLHTLDNAMREARSTDSAAGRMRDRMVEALGVMSELKVRIQALKPKVGLIRKGKVLADGTPRAAKAMTCQVCGRDILAETGLIALHGYNRPGTGWQTESCEGARCLPFEVERDVLGRHLDQAKARLSREREHLERVRQEEAGIVWRIVDKRVTPGARDRVTSRMVTRETFEAVKAETDGMRGGRDIGFDDLKKAVMDEASGTIKALKAYVDGQRARYDGWTGPTHERRGDEWIRVAP